MFDLYLTMQLTRRKLPCVYNIYIYINAYIKSCLIKLFKKYFTKKALCLSYGLSTQIFKLILKNGNDFIEIINKWIKYLMYIKDNFEYIK